MRQAILWLFILSCSTTLLAQLDSVHYLPPMHARTEWGPQFVYLSTPEESTFPVQIKDGSGQLLSTVFLSNSQPARFDLGASNSNQILVTEQELHQPLTGRGLQFIGEKRFYVAFRTISNSQFQAGDLTCKGSAALGTTFRIGHVIQGSNTSDTRSNFIGVLATEDSTVVQLTGFDPAVKFRVNYQDQTVSAPLSFSLQAGESLVISQYINSNPYAQPPNGLMGSLVQSNHPVAVNVGSWTGAPVTTGANDIGIDQIAPFELMGKEYILCKGNGSSQLETPILVAHLDNTRIYLNGNGNPVVTLSAGQYYVVPTSQYSAFGNLHVESSEPIFVYQMIGGVSSGNDAVRTAGLIFVPPISCSIPNAVDNIYQPSRIGGYAFDGGVMIVAMKDSLVQVQLDGVNYPLGAPDPVPGAPDFVSYRRLNMFSTNNPPESLRVVAEGAVQVALFGRNGAAGYGAFFSGFSKEVGPEIQLSMVGDGVCPDTLLATGRMDGVQWYYADSLISFGPDTFLTVYGPGKYTARGYLGVCRKTDFAEDTLTIGFVSPAFPFETANPSCYGYQNGVISIGQPYGGIAPYQYSIDKGGNFSSDPQFTGLGSGDYSVVVRDSTGCYNYPLSVELRSPDSFGLYLVIASIQDPPLSGEPVILHSSPTRSVQSFYWLPVDTLLCGTCDLITVYPTETTVYEATAIDSMGCTVTERIQVPVQPPVYAPNVFAPGIPGNDVFTLFAAESLLVEELLIYDRWGGLVFEGRNLLTNVSEQGWNGMINGRPGAPGVYFFQAVVQYLPGKTIQLTGDVTLLR
ncbi:MAG: hypothetical protein ACK5SQ_11065 [Chitinophagales bacterium]